jgi:hypothetical protein
MKETDAQRAICDYLALKRHFFWRNNNTPIFDAGKMVFRAMPKYTMKGIPDIIVIDKTGHFIGLEVKGPKAKLSEDQEAFRERCKANGAEYYLVRSIDDVKEIGL